jgi:hypothetical protein
MGCVNTPKHWGLWYEISLKRLASPGVRTGVKEAGAGTALASVRRVNFSPDALYRLSAANTGRFGGLNDRLSPASVQSRPGMKTKATNDRHHECFGRLTGNARTTCSACAPFIWSARSSNSTSWPNSSAENASGSASEAALKKISRESPCGRIRPQLDPNELTSLVIEPWVIK